MEYSDSFVYDKAPNKKPKPNCIDLTFSIFFDGTQNNKTNTELGENKRDAIRDQGTQRYHDIMKVDHATHTHTTATKTDPNEPLYNGGELAPVEVVAYMEQGDSYENDYTNVARLFYAYKEIEGKREKIYIEGVGTADRESNNTPITEAEKELINSLDQALTQGQGLIPDDMLAVATGVFATSVRAKARKACALLLEKLAPYKKDSEKIIDVLTIDAFGFSRGATTARYFTHLITCNSDEQETSDYYENHDLSKELELIYEKAKASYHAHFSFMKKEELSWTKKGDKIATASESIKEDLIAITHDLAKIIEKGYAKETNAYFKQQLKKEGIQVNRIFVRFVGLFDTVSSYGLFHDNDVIDLSLDSVNKAYRTVHLVAADEYRKNFALTNIKSTGFKGIELNLPGAHCDIGGAYNKTDYEKTAFFITPINIAEKASTTIAENTNRFFEWLAEPASITRFRRKLIKDGWLKPEQCKPEYMWWLNDTVQSIILTGAIQHMLSRLSLFPYLKPLEEVNDKLLEGLQIGPPPFGVLYGHRMLSNGYSFIPMNFMNELASEVGLVFDKAYIKNEKWIVPSDLATVNKGLKKYKKKVLKLKEKLEKQAFQDKLDLMKKGRSNMETFISFVEEVVTVDKEKKYINTNHKISYLDYLSKEDLHYLRNNYLHWSAKSDKVGLDPVTRSSNYKNKRKKYDG